MEGVGCHDACGPLTVHGYRIGESEGEWNPYGSAYKDVACLILLYGDSFKTVCSFSVNIFYCWPGPSCPANAIHEPGNLSNLSSCIEIQSQTANIFVGFWNT